jgi:hypothetical protein
VHCGSTQESSKSFTTTCFLRVVQWCTWRHQPQRCHRKHAEVLHCGSRNTPQQSRDVKTLTTVQRWYCMLKGSSSCSRGLLLPVPHADKCTPRQCDPTIT